MLDHDYGRAELPRDIEKGDRASVELSLRAPSEPGSYIVRLDMVNEGTCWFAQRGSPEADVSMEVAPP